jgi:hypothetical protein
MAKWRIYGVMTADKFLGEVEADTEEEALMKADESEEINGSAFVSLCHQCAREVNLGDIYEFQASKVDG